MEYTYTDIFTSNFFEFLFSIRKSLSGPAGAVPTVSVFSRWIFIIASNPKNCQRINLNLCVPRSFCLTAFTTEAKNLEVLSFQHFHLLYWQLNGERGIWTLAPRERPTPLAGAPLQPLEYFSIIWIASRYQYSVMSFSQRKSYYT